MSTETGNSQYLLIFRGTNWDKDLSPEQIQQVMGKWSAWFEGLKQQGKLLAGQPLRNEGKVLTGKGGRNVADGPFAESKEAVGGYFLLQVDSLDEAVDIGRQCPALEHGIIVEVRPVAVMCATMQRANELAAGAGV
jgi:hypothetical protein